MSLCCENCFNDEYLKKLIKEVGRSGSCDFCGIESQHCVEPVELQDIFLPLVNLYDNVTNFMPRELLKDFEGHYLWEKLNDEWEVFAFYDSSKQEALLREIGCSCDLKEESLFPLDDFVEMKDAYWGDDVERDSNLRWMWKGFCDEIQYNSRFFIDQDSAISELYEMLPFLKKTIHSGEIFYRARISQKKKYLPKDMGCPYGCHAKEGRGNPKGIAYLYLASDEDTALAETKPYVGEFITIGKFIVLSDLDVIDLRNPCIDSPFQHGDKLKHLVDNLFFLQMLSSELSKPLRPEESYFDYLPTQYLCELIKKEGHSGVIFKSSVSKGHNLLLYRNKDAACEKTELYCLKEIKYEKELIKSGRNLAKTTRLRKRNF